MRKVEYKIYEKAANNGKGGYVTYEGLFHDWGVDVDYDPPQNYSVALIEKPDGGMVMVNPNLVKFLDSPKDQNDAIVELTCELRTNTDELRRTRQEQSAYALKID